MEDRIASTHPSHMLLGELATRFMSASHTLESSYRELQEKVSTLSSQLQREREEKVRLERLAAMGEMALELAHEIRNPLGSIELYASMTSGEHAEHIVRGVRLLNLTVSNILQFGTEVRPTLAPVLFRELLDDVRGFLEPLAGKKSIRLNFECEPACAGLADFELLRRMLLNLVLNALRETPVCGTISVRAATEATDIVLSVADTGPGIRQDLIPRIFDPLFSTNPKGNGLGLSIVKRIVDSHGGTIAVDSSPAGTIFTIRLEDSSTQGRLTGHGGSR